MKTLVLQSNAKSIADAARAALTRLTPRQLEVLCLLCDGLSNKLICRRLNISTGTVKVHISCILRELGVTSRLQAVVIAQQYGLDSHDGFRFPEQALCAAPAQEHVPAAAARATPASHRLNIAP